MNDIQKIILADSRLLDISEILSLIKNGETLYSYFSASDGSLFLEKVTYTNVYDLRPLSSVDIDNKTFLIDSQSGNKISCEKLADEYNSRHGVYSEIYSNIECQAKDYPIQIIHLDGNLKNNNPDNIRKDTGRSRISMSYFRQISNNPSYRKLAVALYPLAKMKKDFNKFIDRDFYEARCYDYTSRPISWDSLKTMLGSDGNINKHVDAMLLSMPISNFNKNQDNPLKVFIASGFYCEDDCSLTSFMESFLNQRGYKVYSPSRDNKHLLGESDEAKASAYQEILRTLKDYDLIIVCINNYDLGCFTGNTEIQLFNGSRIPIKDMKRTRSGYQIMTFSEKQKKYRSGFTYGSIKTRSDQLIVEVQLTTSEKIYCTADHPFRLSNGQYTQAIDLKPGYMLTSVYKSFVPIISKITVTNKNEDVYGLEVMTEDHNYIISIGGLVVKNTAIELGIKAGLWESRKEQALCQHHNNPEHLTKEDIAILNQHRPRIITFSDNGSMPNSIIKNMILKHCASWMELIDFLDKVDASGIQYVELA